MLVTTARYSEKNVREFAKIFASSLNSKYIARGKKSIEELVRASRKLGENTLAIINSNEIWFASISASNWNWKEKILKIKDFSGNMEECELESIKGKDAENLSNLFGFGKFYGGEIEIVAEKESMKFFREGKELMEIKYEILDFKDDNNER
ncbi:hypothetical protein KJ780_01205 [Candidatus Micrarchaeota archaeon]|nr:hypothetical protein [Candidatus Micrarchaeota archaeon]